MCRLSWNLRAPTSWNSQGLSGPVMGLLYLYYYYYYYLLLLLLLLFLQFRACTSVPWRLLSNNLTPCQPYHSYCLIMWTLLFCVLCFWIIMFPFFAEAKTRLTCTFRSLIHNSFCSDPSYSPDSLPLLFSIDRFRHRLLRACLVSSVLWIFSPRRRKAVSPCGSV